MPTIDTGKCIDCIYFRNAPEYLESVYKGLTALSSAYASVRGDDGICLLRDVYLSAYDGCSAFMRYRELP